ncbi:MAG: sigma-54 dependent transcriptional regulator [Acidobacteriota bacterium]
MPKILIVEDKESLRQMLTAAISRMGYVADAVEHAELAKARIQKQKYALVLTDLRLPKGSGQEVLAQCKEADDSTPVIVMTAYGTIEEAVSAMKQGAYDFIQKPIDVEHLGLLIERAIDRQRLLTENLLLKEAYGQAYGFPEIIGEDSSIKALEKEIQKVASTEATVLLQGESGTGKELFARAVHALSSRSQSPFVAVNCAAIPETLVENELFGHEKGAYTGANSAGIGKFELANRGTLFLDEIGELPLAVQSKILRVLETKCFERIGGVRTQEVDVRIVAATNRDLQESVTQKSFRPDLFFRLSVFPIAVPPLRERGNDVLLLADHFVRRFARELKKGEISLSAAARKLLQSYDWPGNVRELQNCIERAVILTENREILPEELHLAFYSGSTSPQREAPEGFDLSGTLSEVSLRAMEAVERAKIAQALRECQWNKTKAAHLLAVGYKTLLSKIKEYRLDELSA